MYKIFSIILLFLILPFFAYSDNVTGDFVESVGVVNKYKINVYRAANEKSKVIRIFYKGTKVVVIGETEDNWLKIKVNNVVEGYVKKDDLYFKNTLKKEAVKNSYIYNKVSLEIKSLIERFNINFSESMYFQQEGVVPQFEFVDMFFRDNVLNLELLYTAKTKFEDQKTSGIENPFENEIAGFIELLFFKMMIYKAELYRINLYKYNYDDKSGKRVLHAMFEYRFDDEQFKYIKNRKGGIWQFVKTSSPLEEMFKYYP